MKPHSPLLRLLTLFAIGLTLIAWLPSTPSTSPAQQLDLLHTAFLFSPNLADGFDFPVGNADAKGSYTDEKTGTKYTGWYIATHTAEEYSLGIHTGEDWNGIGGGNTDKGQPVFATATGKVIAASDYGSPWGNIVLIEHRYLENGHPKMVQSLYAHLETITVEEGQIVNRRQALGTIGTGEGAYPAHLHFEMRKNTLADYDVDYWPSSNGKNQQWVLDHYEKPSAFIKAHRKLMVPKSLNNVLIVFKSRYEMLHFQSGKLHKRYEIALSQNPEGHKQRQGDNRLPEGAYIINQRSRGPFDGAMGPFFGPAWMRLSYPNVFDARSGLKRGIISKTQRDQIIAAHKAGKMPPKNTDLGGGIGIHGWNGEWSNDGSRNLTWGCISMHNPDLDTMYDEVPKGTTILIYP